MSCAEEVDRDMLRRDFLFGMKDDVDAVRGQPSMEVLLVAAVARLRRLRLSCMLRERVIFVDGLLESTVTLLEEEALCNLDVMRFLEVSSISSFVSPWSSHVLDSR